MPSNISFYKNKKMYFRYATVPDFLQNIANETIVSYLREKLDTPHEAKDLKINTDTANKNLYDKRNHFNENNKAFTFSMTNFVDIIRLPAPETPRNWLKK